MNKILFIEWSSFGNDHLIRAMEERDFEVIKFPFDTNTVDTRMGADITEKLVMTILGKGFYFVFSFNYYPVIAIACKACKVPYVSWTYDSPFIQLLSPTLSYETNIPFVFDRGTCAGLEKLGYTPYYLPMAAPADGYEKLLSGREKKYMWDVSMVGSLYNEANGNLYRHFDKLDSYTRGFLDGLIRAQKNVYGFNFLEEVMYANPEIMKRIQEKCPIYAQGDGLETAEWTVANYFLARKVTSLERLELLEALGKNHQVDLFTPSDAQIEGVVNHGKADYHTEAPFVFRDSKINLNISLKSIKTGIPLRAFDIMGCGGFLISNYQEDYLEHFVPGEDMIFYEDVGDLLEKVNYFLEHDELRSEIACNGRRKTLQYHTYKHRLDEMLKKVDVFWKRY